MARHKKLDKGSLLDAAEKLIREKGSHRLSLANVAEMANVSKGGIQSNFGTRDNLVNALLDRWEVTLEGAVAATRQSSLASTSELQIQIQASRLAYIQQPDHYTAMMILVTQSEDLRMRSRRWSQEKLAKLVAEGDLSSKDKLYLMLNDAIIVSHALQFTSLSSQDWTEMLDVLDNEMNSAALTQS